MKDQLHTKRPPQTARPEPAAENSGPRPDQERYTPARLRRKKLSGKERLVLLVPALAAVLAVVVVMRTLDRGASYELTEPACQYYGQSTARLENATLKRTSDGASLLVQGEYSAETTLPIYAANSRKVVLPTDLLYVAPRSGGCDRLVYFSEIECKANGTIVARRKNKTANPQQGFLYDGKDFYLFLEPVVLAFNGYTMELPALSYVEAVYGGYMMVFNYETKECFMELSDGTGTAQPPSGDYAVSLLGDSMTLHDGTKSLLATRADLFDPVV